METSSRTSWVDWNTHNWKFKGINYWKTHRNMFWTSCIIVFHYDWDMRILKEIEFIDWIIEIIDSLINKLEKGGIDYNLNRTWLEYKEWVDRIIKRNQELLDRYDINKINICNIDSCLSEYRALIKYIFESQANQELIQYIHKVNSWKDLVDKLDEDDVISLYGLKTQVFLDVKREEQNFKEKALKSIANEIKKENLKFKEEANEEMIKIVEFIKSGIDQFTYEFK